MAVTIPRAVNRTRNPSAEPNLTDIGATGSATVTREQQYVWAGAWSVHVVTSGSVAFSGTYFNGDLTGLTLTGKTYYYGAKIRVRLPVGQVLGFVAARVYYTDATFDTVQIGITSLVGTGDWQTAETPIGATNPAKTLNILRIFATTWTPAVPSFAFDADGAHFAIEETEDAVRKAFVTYVDGSLGPLYHWGGTAHSSYSYRDAEDAKGATGYGGGYTVSTEVFQSNALGQEFDDLTDYVYGGEISNDIDRDIKGQCLLQVTDPVLFPEFAWIKVYQTVESETDGTTRSPVGLFRLMEPETTWMDGLTKIAGEDVTAQIRDTTATATYNIAAGVLYTTAIATLLDAAGFAGRYVIPASALTVPTGGLSYRRGTSYLDIVNDLLNRIGYYTLYALPDGRLSSIPYVDRLIVEPAHVWTVGQDAEIVGEVVEQINANDRYNYVVAVKVGTDQSVTIRTAENQNPNHPFSTVRLGELAGLPKVYRTKEISYDDAATANELSAKAREHLQLSSMIRYAAFAILPHPDHVPHEVVELQFDGTDAERLTGRWLIESSSMGLVGSAGTVTIRARRVESTV